ncbi:MutS-related protein [Chitinophaga sp. MM2321]|uniref:MutS-related protein n=1 Tax=Chitinophaga sp. MM2321 TaxID=3137178 RepID=UPI0032D599E7
MHHVTDLEIEKQLLPLLDFTGNPYALQQLKDLLLHLPGSSAAVYERQAIIKALINNGYVLTGPNYSRQDFEEVYAFFGRLNSQTIYYDSNPAIAAFQLAWRRRYRYEVKGKLIQLVLMMERLHQYFDGVEATVFPDVLAKRITAMKVFLQQFRAAEMADHIRNDAFGLRDQVFLLDLLNRQLEEEEVKIQWETFFLYEAWLSLAKAMVKHNFSFPEFQEGGLTMKAFYHPLLKQPVKNDLTATGNVMLLTGPNMSGKSTLLKAIGLCVYLAHAGMGVPAAYCRLPFFGSITISINLSDDLKNGYSHFMMEVQQLKQVLLQASAGKKCFAIFDELFRGTNVDDALDISRQTISGLAAFNNSFFVISTHLYQLKPFVTSASAYYIDCVLHENMPRFLYTLKPGWSDLKIGWIIFEQEGLPALLGI